MNEVTAAARIYAASVWNWLRIMAALLSSAARLLSTYGCHLHFYSAKFIVFYYFLPEYMPPAEHYCSADKITFFITRCTILRVLWCFTLNAFEIFVKTMLVCPAMTLCCFSKAPAVHIMK
jgi:hypothetical protein